MTIRHSRALKPLGVLAAGALVAAMLAVPAVAWSGDSNVALQEEPTEPPGTTPPDETTPEEGEEGDSEGTVNAVTLVVILAGGALLIIVIAALASSGRRRSDERRTVETDWQARARSTYGKAKWIHENLTGDFASELGDVEFRRDVGGQDLSTSDAAVLDRWQQLERSIQETTSELYSLEANPPVAEWTQAVHVITDGLTLVKASVGTAAAAQRRYREAEGNQEVDTTEALQAKLDADRAVRESSNTLGQGLDRLRAIV